jgi:hypothetical protein
MAIEITEKHKKKCSQKCSRKSLRTAFIRVSEANKTKEGLKKYTEKDINRVLTKWAKSTKLSYWLIKHDREKEDINPHCHMVLKFDNPIHFDSIVKKFPYSKIESARNIRSCIQYLVHAGHPDKKQYKWEDVITNDYKGLERYKITSRTADEQQIQEIEEDISTGKLKEWLIGNRVTVQFYNKYRRRIESSLTYFYDKEYMDKQRNIKCVFIAGDTGVGKTSWVKDYCKKKKISLCVSSSSNDPMQDYKGEDVLFLDDARDEDYKYSDLLKLTDPYTKSTSKSRYRNKHFTGSMIVISSIIPLDKWYYYDTVEDKQQIKRRLKTYYMMTEDEIRCFEYNDKAKCYKLYRTLENPYRNKHYKDIKHFSIEEGIGLKEKPNISLDTPDTQHQPTAVGCVSPQVKFDDVMKTPLPFDKDLDSV